MATKTKNSLPIPDSSADVLTVVAAGTHVVGRLTGHEDIRVQGTIEGAVRLDTTLFVDPEGVLLAEVYARDVVVSGTIVGNVTADNAIVLTASARVIGDLRAPRVSVAPGAAFRGGVVTEAPEGEDMTMEAAARTYTAGRAPAARVERPNAVAGNGSSVAKPARSRPSACRRVAPRPSPAPHRPARLRCPPRPAHVPHPDRHDPSSTRAIAAATSPHRRSDAARSDPSDDPQEGRARGPSPAASTRSNASTDGPRGLTSAPGPGPESSPPRPECPLPDPHARRVITATDGPAGVERLWRGAD
jgi:cytoskeletal protein CcmA (bactofilin family)